jgi:DNA-binding MarR family transcriptional regulator
VARGECLLDHEAAGAACGSKDYEIHRLPPDPIFLKLKLQVDNLNKLKRQVIPTAKPVRWLNNHEWSAWLHLMAMFTLLPAAIDSQLQREAGMSHFEFSVMAALSRQPGRRLQLKDLAVVANGSLSRLSHVISRLERQGWVRRMSGANGRATNAELTDKGYSKLMEAGPIHFAEVRRLVFDVLTPEQVKELRRVTSRINAALIPETNLGPLARRTRARALRQSS